LTSPTGRIGSLLFLSGACALVYQTTWLREFRLVFGASTEASAAVLAIFIGGLGLGSRVLGARADRARRPLLLYAGLEAGIAVVAVASPLLLRLVRAMYVGLGGTQVLGPVGGGALRLVLSALVLGLPTFLMGGTLPAAARFVERREDAGRRLVALLYGVNTMGAVAGAFLSTFVLLELFGNRRTLLLAALVNLLLAIVARSWARAAGDASTDAEPTPAGAPRPTASAAPAGFVLTAAGLVGFAFFLMELVWYRMLGPLLGGSVFTFGLVLAAALLGIGLGGTVYSLLPRDRPARIDTFAATCLLESACIGLPFALGDRLAAFALALRSLGDVGFHGHVIAWSLVTAVVVLPTAIVAGVQFPMLIALLGHGREDVGRHIGRAYAWNTAGAIVGSLAGGFGLLPALSAVGSWRLVAGLLWALGLAAAVLSLRAARPALTHAAAAVLVVLAPLLVAGRGPSAPWRHGGIGAGRAQHAELGTPNGYRSWVLGERWSILWEREGVESSVALQVRADGVAFIVNGKSDGHATSDGPTQVMSGLLAAALHPDPKTAMVVGLGTGSTAGWLGLVPGMERVDVAELEAAILDVARDCASVNRDVLSNPRVHVEIGDAREILLTTRRHYDIVMSEPSNPYRAGIASLFTLEFYEAVAARMNPGGLFVQWVQPYEVDTTTVLSIYRTLLRVFPEAQVWRTHADMLLLASQDRVAVDPARLRARLASEPYRSALLDTWRVTDLEGFLARFVANAALGRHLRPDGPARLNTDDLNRVEFGFARSVGRTGSFDLRDLFRVARQLGTGRPQVTSRDDVDWGRVDELAARLYGGEPARLGISLSADAAARAEALAWQSRGNLKAAARAWRSQSRPPRDPDELVAVAESLGREGGPDAEAALVALSRLRPTEAELVQGGLMAARGDYGAAAEALERGFLAMRSDPWCEPHLADRALGLASIVAATDRERARRLYRSLREPFAAHAMESERVNAVVAVALALDPAEVCVDALSLVEPYPIWTREFLAYRARCYRSQGDPRAAAAARDLATFVRDAPVRLEDGLALSRADP
jgi:spermidine synthase